MKTQKFNITVQQNGEPQTYPVVVKVQGINVSVCVSVNGLEVHYIPDEHDGLRPAAAECNLDPELLYQIGSAILQQRPTGLI